MAKELANIVLFNFERYNGNLPNVKDILTRLNSNSISRQEIIDGITQIIDLISFRPECQ